jgi:hypothetical protein
MAREEAISSFGDGRLLVEKYIEAGAGQLLGGCPRSLGAHGCTSQAARWIPHCCAINHLQFH